MEMFLSKLILTLMHSLWQSAILLGFQMFFIFEKQTRLKIQRHQTLMLVLAQFLLSTITFFSLGDTNDIQLAYYNETNDWIARHQFYFIIFYFSILGWRLIQTFSSWLSYRSIISSSKSKAHPEIRNFTHFWSAQMGYGQKVNVWISSNISAPLTYGFLKPVILLPASLASSLSTQELEMIIIHELKHIINKDFLTNLFLIFSEIIFCCNPFLLRLIKFCRWNFERECDEQVINLNYDPLHYAELLLLTAKTNHQKSFFSFHLNGHDLNLLGRIKSFADSKENALNTNKRNYLLFGIILSVLIYFSLFLPVSSVNTSNSFSSHVAKAQISFPNFFLTPEPLVSEKKKLIKPMTVAKTQKKLTYSMTAFTKNNADLLLTDADILSDSVTHPLPLQLVSSTSNSTEEVKQMVLKDEDPSSGKSVTKIYELRKIGGQWKVKLLSVILENLSNEVNPDEQ